MRISSTHVLLAAFLLTPVTCTGDDGTDKVVTTGDTWWTDTGTLVEDCLGLVAASTAAPTNVCGGSIEVPGGGSGSDSGGSGGGSDFCPQIELEFTAYGVRVNTYNPDCSTAVDIYDFSCDGNLVTILDSDPKAPPIATGTWTPGTSTAGGQLDTDLWGVLTEDGCHEE